ncbi:hypothetical protein JXO59_07985 [candidate division KSB1 bacterium]|nr:hypothetical protein [candidate division KSB1 bacterium]
MHKSAIFFALALSLIYGCKRDLPLPVPDNHVITMGIRLLPRVMNPYRDYRVEVKVSPTPGNVSYIQLDAVRLGTSQPEVTYYLNDDGDAVHPDRGDVVANDGVFTQVLQWRPAELTRNYYQFRFTAVGEGLESIPVLLDTVLSLDNKAPRILQAQAPELLPSGFMDEKYFYVAVQDSDGVDDIASVSFSGLRGEMTFFTGQLHDDGSRGDAVAGDGLYSLRLDSTFAAAKKGTFDLQFIARDRSNVASNIAQKTITIENEPPHIFNLNALSEATIPLTESNTFLVTLDVRDPQGYEDIQFVGYMALRPDSVYANQGLPIPMVDNGLPFDLDRWSQSYFGDVVANDGTYSITAVIFPTDSFGNPTLKGKYIWTFYAIDFVGQKSEQLVHEITLK